MGKLSVILIILILIVAMAMGYYFLIQEKPEQEQKITNSSKTVINVTKENFASYCVDQSIVKDLPSNAVLLIKFYNFDSGNRQWEDSYIIQKNSVVKGSVENSDITIIIHSKYITDLGKGFCSTIQKAKANNDFDTESSLSTAQLLWKYKSMMSYRDCLGF